MRPRISHIILSVITGGSYKFIHCVVQARKTEHCPTRAWYSSSHLSRSVLNSVIGAVISRGKGGLPSTIQLLGSFSPCSRYHAAPASFVSKRFKTLMMPTSLH